MAPLAQSLELVHPCTSVDPKTIILNKLATPKSLREAQVSMLDMAAP